MAQQQKPKRDFSMRVFSIDSRFFFEGAGKTLSADALLMLFALLRFGGASGEVFATAKTLADCAFRQEISTRYIRYRVPAALKELASVGLVSVEHRKGKPTHIRLSDRLTGATQCTSTGEVVQPSAPGGATECTGTGATECTQVSINSINNEYAAPASLCADNAAQLAGGVDEYGKKKELPKTPVEDLPPFAREKYRMGLAAHPVH